MNELLTLAEFCDRLGISTATGRNWLRSGRLEAQEVRGRHSYFTQEYAAAQKRRHASQSSGRLKSRRNKNYVAGAAFYQDYLDKDSPNLPLVRTFLKEAELQGLGPSPLQMYLADAAIRLLMIRRPSDFTLLPGLSRDRGISAEELENRDSQTSADVQTPRDLQAPLLPLLSWLRGDLQAGPCDILIRDLLGDPRKLQRWRDDRIPGLLESQKTASKKTLPELSLIFRNGEDVLGLLYISCRKLAGRKSEGAYYTPAWLVRETIRSLGESLGPEDGRIFDPCCGTGNFLISLPDTVRPEQIYGNDIDEVSVALTRINLALRYPQVDPILWKEQITCRDYLLQRTLADPDIILGNPPWGSRMTDGQRDRLARKYRTASQHSPESCDVILEKAVGSLPAQGRMAFVLPEAVLQVKSHSTIREILREHTHLQELTYAGDAFHRVQCPCIILSLRREDSDAFLKGLRVSGHGDTYIIEEEREMTEAGLPLSMPDEEYDRIRRIRELPGARTLEGSCDFALGIVTGDNNRLLATEHLPGYEPVIRGSEVESFRFGEAQRYLVWEPQQFQQTAPEEYYRAVPKLMYRFICDHPVMALDRQGRLSLNSCNLMIPREDWIPPEVLVVLFNSRLAAWYWRKNYRTLKILRRHLESFPIPPMTEEQLRELVELERRLEAEESDDSEARERAEEIVRELYGLTKEEYRQISDTL